MVSARRRATAPAAAAPAQMRPLRPPGIRIRVSTPFACECLEQDGGWSVEQRFRAAGDRDIAEQASVRAIAQLMAADGELVARLDRVLGDPLARQLRDARGFERPDRRL